MSACLHEMSDEELSDLAKKLNEDAFQVLLERNKTYMLNVCRKFSDSEHEAEDTFQKSALKAWKSFPKFRGDCSFKSWVYTIIRSHSFDHSRWKKNKKEVSLELFFGHVGGNSKQPTFRENSDDTLPRHAKSDSQTKLRETIVEKSKQPDSVLEMQENNKELGLKLERALSTLSPEHIECLKAVAEGHSYEEIAKMQRCALGTVMSRIFYARKKAQRLCSHVKNYNESV